VVEAEDIVTGGAGFEPTNKTTFHPGKGSKGSGAPLIRGFCSHFRVPIQVDGGYMLASSQRDWQADGKSTFSPTAGVYLDSSWIRRLGIVGHAINTNAGFPALLVDWPDMGVPKLNYLRTAVDWTKWYLKQGGKVEVACIGGHGRTGTFLAVLLREYGFSAHDAVEVVRKAVCSNCIETQKQIDLIVKWGKE
jgi:hypothetical protein